MDVGQILPSQCSTRGCYLRTESGNREPGDDNPRPASNRGLPALLPASTIARGTGCSRRKCHVCQQLKRPHLWALTRNYSKCPLNHALHDVLHGRDAMTRKSWFRMQFRIHGWILSPAVLEDGSDVVRSVMRLRHRNDDQQNKKTNEQQRCFLPNLQANTKNESSHGKAHGGSGEVNPKGAGRKFSLLRDVYGVLTPKEKCTCRVRAHGGG